jgi:hypothetical protein
MKRIIRLTESDLTRIVRRVIRESEDDWSDDEEMEYQDIKSKGPYLDDFDGDIKDFFESYKEQEEDFIAIQAFKKEDYKEFPKISVINGKMKGSHGNWLGLCPGAGDNFKSQEKHIGSFFPIVRFTKKAMDYLLDIHKQGFYGYSEGFVPTSLASEGFKVASMMDEHNNFFIENKSNCTLLHKGIKFTWEWL